ncbi:hypothetical protein [Salinigranum halophilum]|jgi:hypothetical protein|nr:hypothetical protein [Salinigranum halophilum]
MTGDDEPLTPDLRIDLCAETGRIRLHRSTPLGTFTETIER